MLYTYMLLILCCNLHFDISIISCFIHIILYYDIILVENIIILESLYLHILTVTWLASYLVPSPMVRAFQRLQLLQQQLTRGVASGEHFFGCQWKEAVTWPQDGFKGWTVTLPPKNHGSVKNGCVPNRISTSEISRHFPLNHDYGRKSKLEVHLLMLL